LAFDDSEGEDEDEDEDEAGYDESDYDNESEYEEDYYVDLAKTWLVFHDVSNFALVDFGIRVNARGPSATTH
jgi:hypothetical protein